MEDENGRVVASKREKVASKGERTQVKERKSQERVEKSQVFAHNRHLNRLKSYGKG